MTPVYLIGAGPGDPGLITARGLDLLRQAHVVIHDHLVSSALLKEAAVDQLHHAILHALNRMAESRR